MQKSNRREKLFGPGRPRPMDRNLKARIEHAARAMRRKTAAGASWRTISPRALGVLRALLWTFHNAKTGLCFPGLEALAEAADCARSTVAAAIKALEAAGVLTWVNRLYRACGRVWRTTNGYRFLDPPAVGGEQAPASKSSKSEVRTARTSSQDFSIPAAQEAAHERELAEALARWEASKAAGLLRAPGSKRMTGVK